MHSLLFSLCLLASCAIASATPVSSIVERSGSLNTLLSPEQSHKFSSILAADHKVRWKLVVPPGDDAHGVLVFVSPDSSGEPQPGWGEMLARQGLIWIAAEDFGNPKPSAQRVLAALMGLAMVQKEYRVDNERLYIAGMSGGGRIASQAITKFPQLFTGALYIVGVDFWTDSETRLLPEIAKNRYVFLTGSKDFNRRETKRVHNQYKRAGITNALLIDLPRYGHEYPNAQQLAMALEFLDRHD